MKENNLNSRIYAVPRECIFENIISKMSYGDILENACLEENVATDFLPDDLASEIIIASIPLSKGKEFLFLLDISTTLEKKPSEYMSTFIPMYRFVLESYDVTVEQFLEDFNRKTMKDVIEELYRRKNNCKKGEE